jgi:hypothetical protein
MTPLVDRLIPAAVGAFTLAGQDVTLTGPSFDSATTAWEAAVVTAGGTVSGTQKTRVDTLIKALKAHSLWTVQDRIWLFASENVQQATIDIVNLATATNSGATHTASQGYAGNASSTFVDTGFGASVNGVNYTRNSASYSVYVRTSRTTAANKAALAFRDDAGSGAVSRILPHAAGNVIIAVINGTGFAQTADSNAQGFYTVSRTASTTTEVYKNSSSTSIFSDATASTALVSTTFYVGAEHLSGGGNTFFSDDQIAIVAFGPGLSGANAAQFQTDVNAYMTSLGTNVY